MPAKAVPFLIPFGESGQVSHPNRWRAQPGEMTLAQNVTLENDYLQKEPSAVYYGGANGLKTLFSGVLWSIATDSVLRLSLFPATTATAVLGTSFVTASTAPTAFFVTPAVGMNVPVGSVHVIGFSREAGTGGVNLVADGGGNVYTRQGAAVTALGLRLELWTAPVTTALTSAVHTLTLGMDDGTADINVFGLVVTGLRSATAHSLSAIASAAANNQISVGNISANTWPLWAMSLGAAIDTAPTATFGQGYTEHVDAAGAAHHIVGGSRVYRGTSTVMVTQIEWRSDLQSTPAGTVAVVLDSTTVTGTGTAFTTAFRPGDDITVGGETHRVDTITSNTVLNTVDRWANTLTGVAVTRRAGPVLITAYVLEAIGATTGAASVTKGVITKEIPLAGARGMHGDLDTTRLVSTLAGGVHRGKFVVAGKEIAANNRKLFYFNGVDPVQVLSGDGTTMTAITKPAADWGTVQDAGKQPLNAIVHQDSLVVVGNLNDPHRMYISSTDDHEDFQTTGKFTQLRVASNIGDRLVGLGQYQGVLWMFKHPRGIFYLDDTPVDRFQWGYRIRSQTLGCAESPHAVLPVDDDILFMDADGHVHLLSAVSSLGGTRDSDLTRALGLHEWTRDHVDVLGLDQMTSVYDPQTKTAWLGMRSVEGITDGWNDLVQRWDMARWPEEKRIRVTTARVWAPNSLAVKQRDYDGTHAVLIGEFTDSWFVEPGEYGARTNWDFINAAEIVVGIPTRIELPELGMRDEHRVQRKQFVSFEAVFQDGASATEGITVELRVDGNLRETFELHRPDGTRRQITRTLQAGDGYTLQATITTDGSLTTDCGLVACVVRYLPEGEDESRSN